MARQIFDDGSWLEYDDRGNVTGGADIYGAPITPPRSDVSQQVMDLLSFGIKSAIYANYGAAAQQAAQPQPVQGAGALNQLMPVLVLGGIAFLAYQVIKG